MRILQLSQQDDESGSFIAARRLHQALLQAGHEAELLVLSKVTSTPHVKARIKPNLLAKVAWRVLSNYHTLALDFYPKQPSMGWTASQVSLGTLRQIRRFKPDVVQLHLFDCLLTYAEVPKIQAPVFWTFHDMSPFTGGCHCTQDCHRYEQQCGSCLELGSTKLQDASYSGWKQKQKAWSHPHLTGISPSQWLADLAQKSPLCQDHPIQRIPNGVPLDVYTPQLRKAARHQWGFESKKYYLLAGATSLQSPIKGFQYVLDAIQQLAPSYRSHLELVVFGSGRVPPLPCHVRHFGFIQDEATLASLYAACDAYVLPSQLDNFPNMLLESIACGTPCVTFDVGGCPEIVRPGLTGLVAPEMTGHSLAIQIDRIFRASPAKRDQLRQSCRRVAEAEFGLDSLAKAYVECYTQGIERAQKTASVSS